jgi:Mce-associated membrane protein
MTKSSPNSRRVPPPSSDVDASEPVDHAAPADTGDACGAEFAGTEDSLEEDFPEGEADGDETPEDAPPRRRTEWKRALVLVVLPAIALVLGGAAGFLKWEDSSVRDSDLASMESVQAAKDSTVAMLSYRPDTIEKDLAAASNLLTGEFKNSYTSLTRDVVIPGAKQKQISAVAKVAAAAPVSATTTRAVALVFVNQTITEGNTAPTDTASSVRVTLVKDGGRWLVSGFDPV